MCLETIDGRQRRAKVGASVLVATQYSGIRHLMFKTVSIGQADASTENALAAICFFHQQNETKVFDVIVSGASVGIDKVLMRVFNAIGDHDVDIRVVVVAKEK